MKKKKTFDLYRSIQSFQPLNSINDFLILKIEVPQHMNKTYEPGALKMR